MSTEKAGPGFAVDSSGRPVVDPTENVKALSAADNRRQDDLRNATAQRIDADIALLRSHFTELMLAHDKRYEQRFEASQKALEAALAAQKEAVIAALAAQDRAVSKAEAAAEKRFEGVNEFRAQLGDQQRTLMPRSEAESRLSSMAEKIGVLEGFRTEQLSKGSGAKEGYGLAIGMVGLVLVVLSIIGGGIVLFSRL